MPAFIIIALFNMKKILFLGVYCLITFYGKAQTVKIIPGYTGYAIPAEETVDGDTSSIFNEAGAVINWKDRRQHILYYFYSSDTGRLDISMELNSTAQNNKIKVLVAHKYFFVQVPSGNNFRKIKVGEVNIRKPGFYDIDITSLNNANAKANTSISNIYISGPASGTVQFNSKPRRNAASVHLMYPLADSIKGISFYNEVMIDSGFDQQYSYYMACGFTRGYFGMQVNSPTERRIIFSVWDAGREAVDRNKVEEENKVKLLAKGNAVITDGFGNEGTGGHSHWVYDWKPGVNYHFLVTALPDSATKLTIYSGYFFIPELHQWKMIASFSAPKDGQYLQHLYSFNENFDGTNGQLQRRAIFSNQWMGKEDGEWMALDKAIFSVDATGKAGDRIDFGAAVKDSGFYLWNGGFNISNTKPGDTFTRRPSLTKPVIDLYKNADSAARAKEERAIILNAVRAGQIDTTGYVDGVYYKVLKAGTGRLVKVTDTVVAFYKGSLLNGEVFDQTKTEPATFPLNRLIKGWQIGLTKCRVGGKIQLIIPSALAYSIRARSSKIPPDSILLFEIEVVAVK